MKRYDDIQIQAESCKLNLDDILNALRRFDDEDFNGNNGEEYLWDIASSFYCNQDYVIDKLEKKYKNSDMKKFKNVERICHNYFDEFMGVDGYYTAYKVNVTFVNDSAVITCAWTCGY